MLTAIVSTAIVAGCALLTGPRPSVGPGASTSAAASATPVPSPSPSPVGTPAPRLAQLVGQKLIVAIDGPTPTAALLGRIRRGEIGGVILFGRNITTAAAVASLTRRLQVAATAGGQPPLLIAVDQEGGAIKRIPWAPPTLSPPEIGADGRPSTARGQGAATGAALAKLGINVDLAPVADVPASTSSFLFRQGRTFSFDPETTSALADAFAAGLESRGVQPAMKHFPGLGPATRNTDTDVVTIDASASSLETGLEPYRGAIGQALPIVMLSNATYPAYDKVNAAGWSRAISVDLLRHDLRFDGVTITDSLDGTAHARGVTTASLAIRAAAAGTDLLLVTDSEATSADVFAALDEAAASGSIARSTLAAAYAHILTLKAAISR
jgi:beta-N-acetylhexosaminidase